MMRHSRGIVIGTAVVAAFASWFWVGRRNHQRASSAQIELLLQPSSGLPAAIEPADLARLPAPVRRYLHRALPQLQQAARATHVRIAQTGTLRTGTASDRWMPFEAEHVAALRSVGFVWNAQVAVVPLLHIRVRDAYVDGCGSGQVSLFSAITVARDAGTSELNSGSLHRYLAEAVWYPVALLPSSRLTWTPIDDRRALATLTDRGTEVSLEFRFDHSGLVAGIYTPARWGRFDGGYEQRPWEGHFADYRLREGTLVPTAGDVGWYVGDVWHRVWAGRVTAYSALRLE